jgi:hypothetical protein
MATSQGFAVRIGVIDEVTARAAEINRALLGIGRTAQTTQYAAGAALDPGKMRRAYDEMRLNVRATGLIVGQTFERSRRVLGEFGKSAQEVADHLGRLSPALGALGAIGTVGGVATLMTNFATFSTNVTHAAAGIGISTKELQIWNGAAERAGNSAAEMQTALGGVAKASQEARLYGGPALGVANIFGIPLKGDTVATLRGVADAIKRLHDAGQSAQSQEQLLANFGIPADMLHWFQKGREGLDELTDAQRKSSIVTDENIAKGEKLNSALAGLKTSATNTGYAFAGDFAPAVKTAADTVAHWLDVLQKMPGAMSAIEIGGTALGVLFGVTLVAQLGRFAAKASAIWALPLFRFLASPLVAPFAIGAGLGGLGMGINPIPNHAASPGEAADAWRGNGRGQTFMEWWRGTATPGGAGGGATGAPSIWQRLGRAVGINTAGSSNFTVPDGPDKDVIRETVKAAGGNEKSQAAFLAMFNAEDPGLKPGTVRPGGSDASWAQWVGPRRAQLEAFGWTGKDPVADRAASAKMLHWELTTNPQYKAMLQRMNAAPSATDSAKIGGFTYEQGGGDAGLFGGGGHTQANMDWFHSNQAEKFLSSFNTPATAAPTAGLPSLPASYVFGANPKPGKHWVTDRNSGIRQLVDNPVPPDPKAPWLQPGYVLPPLTSGDAPPAKLSQEAQPQQGAGDTSHEVTVHIANAPPGTRTNIATASGPAKLNLRTSHSMDTPW